MSVGNNLAASIPTPAHDPSFYLQETAETFSLQIPTVESVHKLLNGINGKSCWDKQYTQKNIENGCICGCTLTGIFSASIRTGIFPNE